MKKAIFGIADAHRNLINLTESMAEKWVRLASEDYERRISLGVSSVQAKTFAERHANSQVMRSRPYEGGV